MSITETVDFQAVMIADLENEHQDRRDKFIESNVDDLLAGKVEFKRDDCNGWTVNVEDLYCEAFGDAAVYRELIKLHQEGKIKSPKLDAFLEDAAVDALGEFFDDATS